MRRTDSNLDQRRRFRLRFRWPNIRIRELSANNNYNIQLLQPPPRIFRKSRLTVLIQYTNRTYYRFLIYKSIKSIKLSWFDYAKNRFDIDTAHIGNMATNNTNYKWNNKTHSICRTSVGGGKRGWAVYYYFNNILYMHLKYRFAELIDICNKIAITPQVLSFSVSTWLYAPGSEVGGGECGSHFYAY